MASQPTDIPTVGPALRLAVGPNEARAPARVAKNSAALPPSPPPSLPIPLTQSVPSLASPGLRSRRLQPRSPLPEPSPSETPPLSQRSIGRPYPHPTPQARSFPSSDPVAPPPPQPPPPRSRTRTPPQPHPSMAAAAVVPAAAAAGAAAGGAGAAAPAVAAAQIIWPAGMEPPSVGNATQATWHAWWKKARPVVLDNLPAGPLVAQVPGPRPAKSTLENAAQNPSSPIRIAMRTAALVAAADAAAGDGSGDADPRVCTARPADVETPCTGNFSPQDACCTAHCADAACATEGHVAAYIDRLRDAANRQPAPAPKVCAARGASDSSPCSGTYSADDACCAAHCTQETCTTDGHVAAYIKRLRTVAAAASAAPTTVTPPVVHVTVQSPAASGAGAAAPGSGKVSSANWYGLAEDTMCHHPHRFDDSRVNQLFSSLTVESIDELRLARAVKKLFASSSAVGSSATSSASASVKRSVAAIGSVSEDVLMKEPLASILLNAGLGTTTSSSDRRVTAGLVAVLRVLSERDRGKSPDDPTAITVPAATLFGSGHPGNVLAYELLSENLIHTLEVVGRARFLEWVQDAVHEAKKDPIRFVRAGRDGTPEAREWVTECVKVLLVGYRLFLANRRHTWLPASIVDLATGPLNPWALRETPDAMTDLLAFFVVLGLLVLVDDADEDGDIANDSLTAMEEGFKAFLRAWKATFVSCSANREAWNRIPRATRDAAETEAASIKGAPTTLSRSAQKRAKLKAKRDAKKAAAAGAAASSTSTSTPPSAGTKRTHAGAAVPATAAGAAAAAGKGGATADPLANYPAVAGGPKTFNKCHYISPGGDPCSKPPLPAGKVSNNPLCWAHRRELHGMSADVRAKVAEQMKANGITITT